MVQCDDCDRWFHLKCAKLTKLPTAEQPFLCVKCSLRPCVSISTPSTSKGKEQGLVSSDEGLLAKEVTRVLKCRISANAHLLTACYIIPYPLCESGKGLEPFKEIEISAAHRSFREVNRRNRTRAVASIRTKYVVYHNGKPKDWPRFKKTLLETTKQGRFTQLENLHRIERDSRGKAEKNVRVLMP
uniref:PHD domain-containing protein n=1 Tax=Anopheles funestus TaxID=62324 RepID=A0A182RHG9_ANOFN